MKLKLTHIDNACCIYESQGFKILCDPWLTDGAFEGSWYHYPPLHTTFETVKDVDALYISHLHPDHYDEKTLKQFRKNIPIIFLDRKPNLLKRKLTELGFNNLMLMVAKEKASIGPFEITMYGPFCNHLFDESELGNFLDSSIVVESNGKVILNANDNNPDLSSARYLHSRHGNFDIVQLKDSLAGAYPSCFSNLNGYTKFAEAKRLINRQLSAMIEVAKELKANWFQPFASDYQLAGKLIDKNLYLGISAKQYSAQLIANAGIKPIILNEGGSIDLVTQEVKVPYRKNLIGYQDWIQIVKNVKFDYELQLNPDHDVLKTKVAKAFDRLNKTQEKLNYYPELIISVNGMEKYLGKEQTSTHFLKKIDYTGFSLDPRALDGVLDRRYHWNNLMVGCHIEIERDPNVYQPDLEILMSYFHV